MEECGVFFSAFLCGAAQRSCRHCRLTPHSPVCRWPFWHYHQTAHGPRAAAGKEPTSMAIDPIWYVVGAYALGAVVIAGLVALYFRR
jgi:hypothetical protein